MDIQVQELIDKIKKEGIETASQESARIKTEAEAEARHIIEAAHKEAAEIIEKAKEDAARSDKAGVAALEQASRNLIIAFKDEVQALLVKLVSAEVTANYKDDVLKAVLPDLLKSWAEKGNKELAVILPENDLNKLQGFFKDKLTGALLSGVELKSSRAIGSGFRISNKEGSVYYDFSADSVAKLLATYLNPKLAEILTNSAKGL